ncbi:MAG TPA: secretin N-terminal domain-containing protein [Thermoanaerobaculia bacterium]|nr:secretin N-terminal domain-containing protein [Thermoanaerobaculia bacterium]
MKRAVILFALLLTAASAALAEPAAAAAGTKSLSVHTFTFKYKDASKAAEMIKPLMSSEGSMSIQPSTNALVVTDRPDNLKSIVKALTEFDVPPQPFRVFVRLVGASRAEGAGAQVAEEDKDIAPKLAMLGFNALDNLGSADVAGREGDPGIITLPSGYRADFKFGDYDPASDSLQIRDFHLSKQQGDQLTQLLKTTLNLRIGETYIVGATKNAQSQRALMIVLVARK